METKISPLLSLTQDQIYARFGGTDLDSILKRKVYPVWAFTNELVSELLKLTDFSGKKIFGVGGSVDQAASFLAGDAEYYLAVDKRELACLWAEFKFSAFRNLSFDEFRQVFGLSPNQENDFHLYQKIRSNLSQEAKTLFDYIFQAQPANLFTCLKKSKFFYSESWRLGRKKEYLPYLFSPKDFLKIKSKVDKFRIANTDFYQGLNFLSQPLDLIYTSNIFDSQLYCLKPEKTLQKCGQFLKPRGELIIVTYGRQRKIKKILENLKFKVFIFPPQRNTFFQLFLPGYSFYFIRAQKP